MMISSFRKNLRSNEAGQAIILGAVSLLVMAVTIMVTIQLGWTIKEKITIQHAADNAAYTTAAIVARSLNFTAFMNRAIVAQYVTAMAFQAFIGQIEALMMIFGFTASLLLNVGAFFGVLSYIPYVGSVALPIAQAIGGLGDGFKQALDKARELIDTIVDPFLAGTVLFFGKYANLASYYVQVVLGRGLVTAALAKTAVSPWSGGNFYLTSIQGTAGDTANSEGGLTTGTGYNLIAGVHDTLSYQSLFSKHSQKLKSDSSEEGELRAKRLMTELANASREGKNKSVLSFGKWSVGPGVSWETGRRIPAGFILDFIPSNGNESLESVKNFIKDLADSFLPNSVGATMLVESMDDEQVQKYSGDKKNYLFANAGLKTGSAMVSADVVKPFGNFLQTFLEKILPAFLLKLISWVTDALPGVEQTRVVGVQAVGTGSDEEDKRYHCKYTGYETTVGNIAGLIIKAIDKAKDTAVDCSDKTNSDGTPQEKPEECEYDGKENPGTALEDLEGAESTEDLQEKLDEMDGAIYDVLKGLFFGVPGKIQHACEPEDMHKFGGIIKYVSFNIEGFEEDMKYPSFLAAVNKVSKFPIEVGLGFDEGEPLKMQSIGDVQGKKCDDENEFKGCLTEYQFNHVNPDNIFRGLHAWARSQVYYHRPGTWTEPPNLFNPFWKPKLSPLAPYFGGDALDDLGESMGDSINEKIKGEGFMQTIAKMLTATLSESLEMLPELFLLH